MKIRAFSLLFLLMLTSGCMSTRLVASYDDVDIQPHKESRIVYLWGLVQPKDIQAECESGAVSKVVAHTNIGYILVSAITIGIVVPQKIIWYCAPSDEEEFEFDIP
jgi:hypothetical protein